MKLLLSLIIFFCASRVEAGNYFVEVDVDCTGSFQLIEHRVEFDPELLFLFGKSDDEVDIISISDEQIGVGQDTSGNRYVSTSNRVFGLTATIKEKGLTITLEVRRPNEFCSRLERPIDLQVLQLPSQSAVFSLVLTDPGDDWQRVYYRSVMDSIAVRYFEELTYFLSPKLLWLEDWKAHSEARIEWSSLIRDNAQRSNRFRELHEIMEVRADRICGECEGDYLGVVIHSLVDYHLYSETWASRWPENKFDFSISEYFDSFDDASISVRNLRVIPDEIGTGLMLRWNKATLRLLWHKGAFTILCDGSWGPNCEFLR